MEMQPPPLNYREITLFSFPRPAWSQLRVANGPRIDEWARIASITRSKLEVFLRDPREQKLSSFMGSNLNQMKDPSIWLYTLQTGRKSMNSSARTKLFRNQSILGCLI